MGKSGITYNSKKTRVHIEVFSGAKRTTKCMSFIEGHGGVTKASKLTLPQTGWKADNMLKFVQRGKKRAKGMSKKKRVEVRNQESCGARYKHRREVGQRAAK